VVALACCTVETPLFVLWWWMFYGYHLSLHGAVDGFAFKSEYNIFFHRNMATVSVKIEYCHLSQQND
jgi:hypothetical protein